MPTTADRFDLRDNIQFETRVISAEYFEADKRWVLETDRNEKASSRYCVFATGCLSSSNVPQFEGFEAFKGYPTTRADGRMKERLSGLRVGVIGRAPQQFSPFQRLQKRLVNLPFFSERQTILYQRETRN